MQTASGCAAPVGRVAMDFWGRLVVGRWRDGQGLAGAGSGFSYSGTTKGRGLLKKIFVRYSIFGVRFPI